MIFSVRHKFKLAVLKKWLDIITRTDRPQSRLRVVEVGLKGFLVKATTYLGGLRSRPRSPGANIARHSHVAFLLKKCA